MCAVAGIEESNHQLLDFVVVHKSEVGNTSTRMELEGVKRLITSVETHAPIGDIIVDKHPQVCNFLRRENYSYGFDPWHRLKSLKRELRKLVKGLEDEAEKAHMKELNRRFITHLYTSIEKANGDANLCKELVFSFFLHIQGIDSFSLISPINTFFRYS